MPNVTNHQGNAKQNQNQLSPHTCQNGSYQNTQELRSVGEDMQEGDPLCTVGGDVNWYSHYGGCIKIKNKTKQKKTDDTI